MAFSRVSIIYLCTTRSMHTHSMAAQLPLTQQRFVSASVCDMTIPADPVKKALKKPRRSKKKVPSTRLDPLHYEKLMLSKEEPPIPPRPSSSQERISQLVLEQKLRFDDLKKRDGMLLMEKVSNAPLSQREFIDRYMSKATRTQSTTEGKRRASPPPIEYFAIWLQTNPATLIQNIIQRALDDSSTDVSESTYSASQESQLHDLLPPSSSSSSDQVLTSVNRSQGKRRQMNHDVQSRTLGRVLQKIDRLAAENRLLTQPHIVLLHHLQSTTSPISRNSPESSSQSFPQPETPPKASSSLSPSPLISRTRYSSSSITPHLIDDLWSRYLRMIPYTTSPLYKIIFHSLVWSRDCILLLVHDIQLPKNLPRDPNNKTFNRAVWNLPPEGVHDLLTLTVWKSKRVDDAHVARIALRARLDERRTREEFLSEQAVVGARRRKRPRMGIGEVNWLRIGKDVGEATGTFAGRSIQ